MERVKTFAKVLENMRDWSLLLVMENLKDRIFYTEFA
jgi:hypothetical protein